MNAEKNKLPVTLNGDVAANIAVFVNTLPYNATKEKLWAVFRLAVLGGLDSPSSKLDTWDIAFIFDQLIDLLQILEQVEGLNQELEIHQAITA